MVVAPPAPTDPAAVASDTPQAAVAAANTASHRSHTVARGESLWTIAKRYGVATSALVARNKLDARARLRPGMVLAIDDEPAATP